MVRIVCGLASLAAMIWTSLGWSADVTEIEMKWLRAGWPVLQYAESQHLPIDIVVQPEAKPGDVPFAMAVEEGRCQLVLSMRGNPDAEATLANVPAEQINLVIEAMTAHEVAHCWRYVHGVWHTIPAGFVERPVTVVNDAHVMQLEQKMRDTRREEAFADLVGLAWILREHPEQYAMIYTWLEQIRKDQPVAGAHHDTRLWIQLARDSSVFDRSKSPFEQASKVWAMGLLKDESGASLITATHQN